MFVLDVQSLERDVEFWTQIIDLEVGFGDAEQHRNVIRENGWCCVDVWKTVPPLMKLGAGVTCGLLNSWRLGTLDAHGQFRISSQMEENSENRYLIRSLVPDLLS